MSTYIVWSPQGQTPPTVTFNRRWAAENAAKRLSQSHPNSVFHVCKVKSTTIAGQTTYFGQWRPRREKKNDPWMNWKSAETVQAAAVSEADLIDEQPVDVLYRLGMAAMVAR